MRSLIIAAAIAFASSASAAAIDTYSHGSSGGGAGKVTHHYQWDAHKRCHDERGRFAAASFCASPLPVPPSRCRDPRTGRFISCRR